MATLGSSSTPLGSASHARTTRSCIRKFERCCCATIIYFPLLFVYSLTTWAVWVQIDIGMKKDDAWTGSGSAFVAIVLYLFLNWSYTTAVFTDPGSPMRTEHAYSVLPSHEPPENNSLTVKSTGELRFCKKCQTRKPDRAHHCSTCRRCVLKMDHHCPWLATCVGLRNYKPFLLFLVYTSLFCWVAFASSATWVWRKLLDDNQYKHSFMPVNYILLTVMSGIIGLVLSGFTLWHVYLACRGQTTIESLEKTRYLSPLRRSAQQHFQNRNYLGEEGSGFAEQLREIHANALPGVTRPEEGEERVSPAQGSLRRNYQEMERVREQKRYDSYLDERDSDQLPNAFDLGWKRNLRHVLGEKPSLWALPICNTTGDGWQWETSRNWIEAKERLAKDRQDRARENQAFENEGSWSSRPTVNHRSDANPSEQRSHFSKHNANHRTSSGGESTEASSDDSNDETNHRRTASRHNDPSNWNDIPEDFLRTPSRKDTPNNSNISRSRSPR